MRMGHQSLGEDLSSGGRVLGPKRNPGIVDLESRGDAAIWSERYLEESRARECICESNEE